MAELSGKETDALPDSCFAYVEEGEKKDGKTTPLSKRHLPYKKADGTPDLAHVRNALARLDQCEAPGLTAEKKASIRKHLKGILKENGGGKENAIIGAVDLVMNTAGAPLEVAPEGWYQIGLVGEWKGHPQGAYKLAKEDLAGIVAYFNSRNAGRVDLPIDFEHQTTISRLVGKQAEAAGWIDQVETRENSSQLWAHLKWTDEALALIRAKKFRYLSPVFAPNRENAITGAKLGWVLDSVALTNKPFLTELPAVVNATDAAGLGTSVAGEKEDEPMNQLLALLAAAMSLDAKAVANSLGVPEDAKAEDVVAAISRLIQAGGKAAAQVKIFANSLGVPETADQASILSALAEKAKPAAGSQEAETKVLAICNAIGTTPDKPLADILALLTATRSDPKDAEAVRLIENAISVERKITPANRDRFLALARKDLEGTKAILNTMPPVLGAVLNSAAAESAAAAETAGVLTPEEKWAAKQQGLPEAELLAYKQSRRAVA